MFPVVQVMTDWDVGYHANGDGIPMLPKAPNFRRILSEEQINAFFPDLIDGKEYTDREILNMVGKAAKIMTNYQRGKIKTFEPKEIESKLKGQFFVVCECYE
jgi:hypothetical protein